MNILFDCTDIFYIFLDRIGIVIAQVAHTAVLLGGSEIDANRLSMPDVQVAVRFRWKTGIYLVAVLLRFQILINNAMNKIR